MQPEMGIRILDFLIAKDIITDDVQIIYWGGEPTEQIDTISKISKEYPQLSYFITTNSSFKPELASINNLSLAWSMGDAKEKYGSISGKLNDNIEMVDFVKKNQFAVSLFSGDYNNLYYDYSELRKITDKVIIELPMKYIVMSEDDINEFANQLCRIMKMFGDEILLSGRSAGSYIERIRSGRSFYYCGCGIDRIMIDSSGTIWRCDGSYINGVDIVGNIIDGIDWAIIESYKLLERNPKEIYNNCVDCEIYGYCVRTKCLGDNLQITGDIYKPDIAFCKGNIAFYRGVKKYLTEIGDA